MIEAAPVDAELAIAGQAGPFDSGLPVFVEAAGVKAVIRQGGQHGIANGAAGGDQVLALGYSTNFEQAAHGVGDGVGEGLVVVLQAVLGQPAFCIALRERPFGIFYGSVEVAAFVGDVENPGQTPGAAGVVGVDLLSGHG